MKMPAVIVSESHTRLPEFDATNDDTLATSFAARMKALQESFLHEKLDQRFIEAFRSRIQTELGTFQKLTREKLDSRCVFLGASRLYDHYYCTQMGTLPTVSARFGNDGPEYSSGMSFGRQAPFINDIQEEDPRWGVRLSYLLAKGRGLALGHFGW